MFGCFVAGRAPLAAEQVDETRFVFALEDVSSLNHVALFLTSEFPQGFGASVHLQLPGKDFQQLGILTNAKPSAIYRLKGAAGNSGSNSSLGFAAQTQNGQAVATLGLLCQDLHSLEASMALNAASPAAVGSNVSAGSSQQGVRFANKIAKNLFHYLSSFGQNANGSQGQVVGNYVEISLIERWLRGFESKTQAGGTAWLDND